MSIKATEPPFFFFLVHFKSAGEFLGQSAEACVTREELWSIFDSTFKAIELISLCFGKNEMLNRGPRQIAKNLGVIAFFRACQRIKAHWNRVKTKSEGDFKGATP